MGKPINTSENNENTEIDNEIKQLINSVSFTPSNNNSYRDLTHLKTYTIDETDTIEIDDAISLERINNKLKVWIHIATPAAIINYNSALDRQARKKISSLYLCKKNEYMFPEEVIEKLLSLKEKEYRYAISIGAIIQDNGEVSSYDVAKSIVKPLYRLNYDDADELIDYIPKKEEELYIIYKLLESRKNWRKKNGAIEIIEPQGRIKVSRNTPFLKIIEQTPSRMLISESMILFGDIISKFTITNKITVPYRVQDSINKYRINSNYNNRIVVNHLLKKTLGKTYYTSKMSKHNSLGLNSYTHSSSPIRRYADLLVHYQILNFLNKKKTIERIEIESLINNINKSSRQNINKYREDQKEWIIKWFLINPNKVYKCIFLSWINPNENRGIIYFTDYCFSQICILESKNHIDIGDEINVINKNKSCDDIIYISQV